MILKLVREGLGRLIVLGDHLSRPAPMKRSAAAQAEVDELTRQLSLYQFYACPFCTKTRRAIHKLGLTIETRDAKKNAQQRSELEQLGGRIKVPCLRIQQEGEDRWLYQSDDIIAYLERRFAPIS